MSQPSIIVYSATDVSNIPMTDDDNTFTGTNTFSGAVVLNGALSGTSVKDEDTMSSDSSTAVPTQQSTKAYVDVSYAILLPKVITFDGNVIINNDEVVWKT